MKEGCFKSIKVPLQHILKTPDLHSDDILNAVMTCHKVETHTLLFMKLYLLDYFNIHDTSPIVDNKFVNACMKIICTKTDTRGAKPSQQTVELKNNLTKFYELHYKPLMVNEVLEYTHLNTVFDYLSTDIITMYENNIKLHYIDYVERYINIGVDKKATLCKIKETYTDEKERNLQIREYCKKLRRIKKDLLTLHKPYKSHPMYHNLIDNLKRTITPNKEHYEKDSLCYDVKCSPWDYLPSMIRMMKEIEQCDLKIFNVFPIRTEIIPKHITLDTTTLVYLLLTKNFGKKNDFVRQGNLKKKAGEIWDFFFLTDSKCFKKSNYTFHHMIQTDGVSCSILFKKNQNKEVLVTPNMNSNEMYIDELENTDHLVAKKLVA